jgi:uncharacterized membrane protein YsdA (DUF1294 family)/cold shock CspA family protein
MKSGLRKGQLITWKDKRGFGFIHPDDSSQDVFLHISELKDVTRRPQVGDTIYYHVLAEAQKVRAKNAFILGARSKPKSSSVTNKVRAKARSTSKFPVLKVLLLSVVPLVGAIHFFLQTGNLIPLILYPVMSLVTFFLYSDDKSRAQKGQWRTSENTLHLCELMGGWLGGFVAQRKLRHKSSKQEYQIVFWGIVIIHHIGWFCWLFLGE